MKYQASVSDAALLQQAAANQHMLPAHLQVQKGNKGKVQQAGVEKDLQGCVLNAALLQHAAATQNMLPAGLHGHLGR